MIIVSKVFALSRESERNVSLLCKGGVKTFTWLFCYTIDMKRTPEFTFFFSDQDVFSNWHPMPFSFRGIQFGCGEQFMMYAKARQFNDLVVAEKILQAQEPREQKRLGRQVKGFDKSVWDGRARHTVYVGSRERFTQNEAAYGLLLSTKGTQLVEASPYDKIWGIGLSASDPRAEDPAKWQGTNWLGQVLTKLRDDLLLLPRPDFSGSQTRLASPRPGK